MKPQVSDCKWGNYENTYKAIHSSYCSSCLLIYPRKPVGLVCKDAIVKTLTNIISETSDFDSLTCGKGTWLKTALSSEFIFRHLLIYQNWKLIVLDFFPFSPYLAGCILVCVLFCISVTILRISYDWVRIWHHHSSSSLVKHGGTGEKVWLTDQAGTLLLPLSNFPYTS